MNKQALIQQVTERVPAMKRGDAEAVVNTLFDTLARAMTLRGDPVQIRGFGSFQVHERKARDGKNPRTGEAIQIPAKRVARFRAGKELIDRINRKAG